MKKEKVEKKQKNKKLRRNIFAAILAVLLILPLITAQFNYGKNALAAQSFAVFNVDGYIQNQSSTSVFSYGFQTSNRSGCGWIASYNVLQYLYNNNLYDEQPKIEDVILPFDRFGAFGYGFLGTNPIVIKAFLERRGLRAAITTNEAKFEENAKEADISIIAYLSRRLNYGHYQMVEYDEVEDNFLFYTPHSRRTMDDYIDSRGNDIKILISIKA